MVFSGEEHLRVREHDFGSFGVSPLCVTTVTSAHPCLGWLVGWCWLGWFLFVSVGELIFDLFLTSSNNLTATVESNAATEKKKANVPKSWPLARLTIPLSAASKHLERLFEGYCMEVLVTNSNPDSQLHFVRKFAKDLVVVFAFHLAETISALFRHVLDHPSKVLYDPETEPLFLTSVLVLPHLQRDA